MSIPYRWKRLRQARQNRLELVDNLRLDSDIVDRRLVLGIARADGNVAAVALEQDDVGLPWQTCTAAPVGIAGTEESGGDAGKDVLELVGVVAFALLGLGEVDVEKGACWQVGLSAGDDGGGDVEGEVGVDGRVERRGSSK